MAPSGDTSPPIAHLNLDWAHLKQESKATDNLLDRYNDKVEQIGRRCYDETGVSTEYLTDRLAPKDIRILAKVLNRLADLKDKTNELHKRKTAMEFMIAEKSWLSGMIDVGTHTENLMEEIERELTPIDHPSQDISDGESAE